MQCGHRRSCQRFDIYPQLAVFAGFCRNTNAHPAFNLLYATFRTLRYVHNPTEKSASPGRAGQEKNAPSTRISVKMKKSQLFTVRKSTTPHPGSRWRGKHAACHLPKKYVHPIRSRRPLLLLTPSSASSTSSPASFGPGLDPGLVASRRRSKCKVCSDTCARALLRISCSAFA